MKQKLKYAEHIASQGVKIEDVKLNEKVDMGAGCFLQLRDDGWIQWDGGYGIACSESDVIKWLSERG